MGEAAQQRNPSPRAIFARAVNRPRRAQLASQHTQLQSLASHEHLDQCPSRSCSNVHSVCDPDSRIRSQSATLDVARGERTDFRTHVLFPLDLRRCIDHIEHTLPHELSRCGQRCCAHPCVRRLRLVAWSILKPAADIEIKCKSLVGMMCVTMPLRYYTKRVQRVRI
jgi:hypothetical protein